jgi:hypothetical protein
MRKRLYFLISDLSDAHKIVDDLLLARIGDSHIHVMARDDIALGNLPKANLLQTSDIIHGLELGLIIGGLTGLVGGVVATIAISVGAMFGGVVLTSVVCGALIGSWIASMIGSDVPNSRLKKFDKALARGKILLMVDVPNALVGEITHLIESHQHVHKEGLEPTIPAFP